MNRGELVNQIRSKRSFLCVGLDTDVHKIPRHLLKSNNPVLEFNKAIIDATKDLCVAYKLNIAFYESLGAHGWHIMEDTLKQIPDDIFIIADAKRGDIGNTSRMYAKTFFQTYDFDAITVAPYMGSDSVSPFLEYEGKWVILLALTSNEGSKDFQYHKNKKGIPLYQKVLKRSQKWSNPDNMMYVVGATHPKDFKEIREIAPDHFLLVPGVGAQGGSLKAVAKSGMNKSCGLLINSSRGIIYASNDEAFAEKARESAMQLQSEMESILKKKKFL